MNNASIALVSGLLTYDSGKTWFVIGLAKSIIEKGYSVAVFKPVAGHNLWSQYKAFQYSVKAGMLLGEDVGKYISYLKLSDQPQIMNPIDILLAPPDPVRYISNRDLISYLEDLENQFKQMVLARYSDCEHSTSKHYVFSSNIAKLSPHIKRIVEKLSFAVEAEDASAEDFIARLKSASAEENIDKCLSKLMQGKDLVIVESFNDAITPYIRLLDKVANIFVVMPAAVAIYSDIVKVKNVVIENVKRFGELGLKAYNLLQYLPPDNVMSLMPRTSEIEYDSVFEELIKILFS
ncbi:MAG: hypothetical protein QW632_00870 [Ignisphaera sp.]